MPKQRGVSLPRHRGRFGAEQARRLLWRAGFGPRPGQAERLARLGLDGAVHALTRPASMRLVGPRPHDGDGLPLAPRDAWGHDHCWWLDRMVRTQAPLVERMTLVWHDWFATSKAGSTQGLMLRQNTMLRRHWLGRFDQLALDVTRDPAMLLWLNGVENHKGDVNENYARELQELFCLGAGRGYTERDVRQLARALSGFRSEWSDGRGPYGFRFDPQLHDGGVKSIYGRRGRYGWQDAVRLVVGHHTHPSFLVSKLWSYFVPTPPPPATARALERLYVRSGRQTRPLVEAILRHPHLYDRERRMTLPPVVQAAGMLRAVGRGVESTDWSWLCDAAGQLLFMPPNVAGWDDTRWMDTATFRARWQMAAWICREDPLDPEKAHAPSDPAALVDRARGYWAHPPLTRRLRDELESYAKASLGSAKQAWERAAYPVLTENALRMLIASSPDFVTS
jgi:uncharacterized protein (DUF1800 family)